MRDAIIRDGNGKLQQRIEIGPHALVADEPRESGGDDLGPAPHDYLLAALGACTSMTLKLYAERKGWPLRHVEVTLRQEKTADAHVIERRVKLEGDLDDDQRARLLDIASRCPVARTLTGEIRIDSKLL